MLTKFLLSILNFLDFLIVVAVGCLLVYFFYLYSFYPFDSVDILYYFSKINFLFPDNMFYSILFFYFFAIALGLVYIIFYNKIKFGRLIKALILSSSFFLIYSIVLLIIFGVLRFKEMGVFLLQDSIAISIFYFTLALLYKRNKKNEN